MLTDMLSRRSEITWETLFHLVFLPIVPNCGGTFFFLFSRFFFSKQKAPDGNVGNVSPEIRRRETENKKLFRFVFNIADVALISFCSQATYREAISGEC